MRTSETPTSISTSRSTAPAADGALPVTVAAIVAVLVLVGLPALLGGPGGPAEPPPRVAATSSAQAFLDVWAAGAYEEMTGLVVGDGGPVAAAAYEELEQRLEVEAVRADVARVDVAPEGGRAVATFDAALQLAGLGEWTYEGALPLSRVASEAQGPDWRVAWEPSAIHPALSADERLERRDEWPERAPLLAVDGTALTGEGAPSLPALEAQLLGRVGPASSERAAELGQPYESGDRVGLSGLQAAYERRLAGRPGWRVVVVGPEGEQRQELHRQGATAGEPVRTALAPAVQAAAEGVLGGVGRAAALVALDVGTGEVRAVVNRPLGGFNRALQGAYPPGSTFKVVTATAILRAGITPDDVVPCPATAAVAGRRFSNAGAEALGDVPFRTAFYRSCNTAFLRLAAELEPDELVTAAEDYGFNADPALPVPAATPRFPTPESLTEQVAAAIGQARVTASPLHMATVAAAVASGAWHPPRLVIDEAPAAARPLDPDNAATLRELMRLVVATGTGQGAALPGEPVAGKTGTAEYGTGNPPPTHAWFIGFRGDLAVAVVVEGAGFGGEVAAPLARAFFAAVG